MNPFELLSHEAQIDIFSHLFNKFYTFLGIRWHRWKWFRLLRSMLTFHGLSVCQSLTFVHFAQTAQNIHMIFCSMSLQDPVKIWLTSVYPFLPKFCPKVTHLVLISASETFDSKLCRWLDGENGHNREPIANYHYSLEEYHRWSPSPKIKSQMPGQTTRHVLPPGECDRRAMSPFAKLLWPLLQLTVTICIFHYTDAVSWINHCKNIISAAVNFTT